MKEWRPVVGFESCYRVSNYGDIESLHWRKPKLLRPHASHQGYLRVFLMDGKKLKRKFVHRIVLEAFVGPCPEGLETAHGDNNPRNNRLTNLEWTTRKTNHSHKKIFGTHLIGSQSPNAKLTEQKVSEIRNRKLEGQSLPSIAKDLGIDFHTIHRIIYRKVWKHVT